MQLFPACWRACPIISCKGRAMFYHLLFHVSAGEKELCLWDEFCSPAHHDGRHPRRGTSSRPFPPLATRWGQSVGSMTAFSLGSSPTSSSTSSGGHHSWVTVLCYALFLAYLYMENCNSEWKEECAHTRTQRKKLQINPQHINETHHRWWQKGVIFVFFFVLS